MRILPYDQFTVSTELSPDEVVQRLKNYVQQSTFLPSRRDLSKPFIGTVSENEFDLSSTPAVLFTPKLEAYGVVEVQDHSTQVHIQLSPSSTLLTVLQGVFCMLSVLLFEDSVQVIVLVVMLVFVAWFLLQLPFWLDGDRLRKKLVSACDPTTES